jgi:hypothetical protein
VGFEQTILYEITRDADADLAPTTGSPLASLLLLWQYWKMRNDVSCIAGLAAAGLLLAASAGAWAQDDTRPLSPAQVALFESDHLRSIGAAERLEYRFHRETPEADSSYSDHVDIDVRPRADGGKDVWTEFLTGERRMPAPPLMDFHGNPVIMFFLEHDVVDMNKLTGGATTYFRNRIRQAFVDKAELRQVTLDRDGKAVNATEITLTPFKGDERLAVFPGLAEKRYRFVLSDAVPGAVLEIEAAASSTTGRFSAKDTMTFVKTEPCVGETGPCKPAAQP